MSRQGQDSREGQHQGQGVALRCRKWTGRALASHGLCKAQHVHNKFMRESRSSLQVIISMTNKLRQTRPSTQTCCGGLSQRCRDSSAWSKPDSDTTAIATVLDDTAYLRGFVQLTARQELRHPDRVHRACARVANGQAL